MTRMTGKLSAVVAVMVSIVLFTGYNTQASDTARLYRGLRPLGMGNAFITVSDDENALFFNPAGLNDIKGFHGVALLNPTVEIGNSSLEIIKDLSDLETEDTAAVTDFLEGIVGEKQFISVSFFPNVTFHNFSIGFLGVGTADITVRNRVNPKVITDVRADYGPVLGFGFGTYNGMLQFGIAGKYINRKGLEKTFTAVDIVNETFDPFDDLDSASDFSFDLGMKVNPQVKLNPSVALAVRNITDLDFDTLGKVPQTIDFGVGIRPKLWILDCAFVLQLDDLTKEVSDDLGKRLHLGMEFRFPMILSLRAGLNQGWTTAGVDIDLWILKLGYVTYAEEVGVFAGQNEDRRHIVKLSLGF